MARPVQPGDIVLAANKHGGRERSPVDDFKASPNVSGAVLHQPCGTLVEGDSLLVLTM